MPIAVENHTLLLAIAALVGIGSYLVLRAARNKSRGSSLSDARESLLASIEWSTSCEELNQEIGLLRPLLESFETQIHPWFDEVDDTTVIDLECIVSIAEEMAQSENERRANLQAALENNTQCPDWEQESPEMVSIIEGLSDLCEPTVAGPVGPDDLKAIRGIGKVLEGVLNERGIYTFEQLAALSLDDIEALARELKHFGNRVHRDRWIEQAKALAASTG